MARRVRSSVVAAAALCFAFHAPCLQVSCEHRALRYTLKQRCHGDRDKKQLFGTDVPFGTSPAPRALANEGAAKADVRALAAATAALLLSDRRYGRSHIMSKHLDL